MTTLPDAPTRKKLIEVSLPLEDINAASGREKSIRQGHPSTLHLWWSRKPLSAARAILFAQLVDDPSSNPDLSDEEVKAERARLHGVIRRLVKWENINDEIVLREAHEEILKSTGGTPPRVLDPFAGGGTIPLEAQRLGLRAEASDLNPVAVLIDTALIEIPPKFDGLPPVFPGAADMTLGGWSRATGLAEDVRRYGAWVRDRAKAQIGHLYPDTSIDPACGKKSEATTIAWIWARTVTCPNPACRIEMPLVGSWWLGKKKGKEAYVVPSVVDDPGVPCGRRVDFSIGHGESGPSGDTDGTMSGRSGGTCVACGFLAPTDYIKSEGRSGRLGARLMAVVAEGNRRRVYVAATHEHERASDVERPANIPNVKLGYDPRALWTPSYGIETFSQLFTNRQLVALTTFSDLVAEARERVVADALAAGLLSDARLRDGGAGAEAYADAVATYLGVIVSRLADYQSSITTWASNPQMEILRNAFVRQAIPMSWGFAEGNPFGPSSGTWQIMTSAVSRAIDALPAHVDGKAVQADAATRDFAGWVVSTDPPYYDNIGYSDLSDFFYVWLRRSLREIYPDLFAAMVAPKADELVANPYRHNGREGAEAFFQAGFEHVFARAREGASEDFPITVYYAFKQSELEQEGITSTGWATVLEGMIREGWAITATWPVRSERAGRMNSIGTNSLASSIVLVLRPRLETAGQTTRRGFLSALKRALPAALEQMRQSAIAPVDLAQATIGPGMSVFSSFHRVVENDGSDMSVKTALALINQVVDEVLAEQEGDLDADSRFCLKWYEQYGWDKGAFGGADVLARAYNTSVRGLADAGVVTQAEGLVRLVRPHELSASWNPITDHRISVWEVALHLVRVLSVDDGGLKAAAKLLASVGTRAEVDVEAVQRLAYRLYEMTQHKRRDDARLFNLLGGSWTDLTASAGQFQVPGAVQDGFDFEDEG